MRSGRLAAGWAVLLLAAAACGPDGGNSPTTPEPPPPTEPSPPPTVGPMPAELELPDDPEVTFLEVWQEPGFVPIEYKIGRPPRYALSVGGSLYHEGPVFAIFPGPLLPDLWIAEIPGAAFDSVVAAIRETALLAVDDLQIRQPTGGPYIADAPTLDVRLKTRDNSHRIAIEAIGIATHTDPRVAPIQELVSLLDSLSAAAAAVRYQGDRLQVFTIRGPRPPDPSVRNEKPWPLPDPPPTDQERQVTCEIHDGGIVAGLLEIFGQANHATRWNFQGAFYQLVARPLLPREEGCPLR